TIEQDVPRVDHGMTPPDLIRVGSDIEAQVLARAAPLHVEHRTRLNGHRTAAFRGGRTPGASSAAFPFPPVWGRSAESLGASGFPLHRNKIHIRVSEY